VLAVAAGNGRFPTVLTTLELRFLVVQGLASNRWSPTLMQRS
jgi:hypothetical protein